MKSKLITRGLVMLTISTLIVTLSSNAFAQRGMGKQRFMNDSARFERCIPNLTPEQKTKIEGLRVKHLKEITPLKNELTEKRAHLRTLESAEKYDKEEINKTIDEMTAIQNQIMKSNAGHRADVSSVLTDEQKAYFNAHHGDGMGNGMGKGMRKGMGKEMKGPNCPNPNCPNKK